MADQRARRVHLKLPRARQAALRALATERLMKAGCVEDAEMLARYVVEEMPGYESLVAWGAGLAAGERPEFDLRAVVLQVEPDCESQETAGTAD